VAFLKCTSFMFSTCTRLR